MLIELALIELVLTQFLGHSPNCSLSLKPWLGSITDAMNQ